MQRTDRTTQLHGSVHCNVPLDWNLGIQYTVALEHRQLRNAGGRSAGCAQPDVAVSSLQKNKGFIPAPCEQNA